MKYIHALFLTALMAVSTVACADGTTKTFKEGSDYLSVSPQVKSPSAQDGVVEVIEFFSYACPHCHKFEPTFHAWQKKQGKNVVVRRVPAVFNKSWLSYAKAFFAAEQLGITEQVHEAIFEAIHTKGQGLNGEAALAKFMAQKSGKDEKTILNAMNSFAVETYVRKGIQLARMTGLRGVPAVSVNGKFLTSASYAGSNEEMINVINHLIQKESKK